MDVVKTNNNDNFRLQPEGSKSADNLDNNDNYNCNKFTVSDSAMLKDCNSGCPICPCTKLPPEECCKKYDHISCIMMLAQQQQYGKFSINTASSSDTYHSAMSSLTGSDCGFWANGNKFLSPKLGTYEEETLTNDQPSSATLNPATISSITRSGILESHFPVYLDSSDEKSSLLSNENSPRFKNPLRKPTKTVRYSQSCNIKSKNAANSVEDDFCGFSRNESLPLLSNLAEKSSPTNYVKRKKTVYPIHYTPPLIQQSNNTITVTTHSASSPASITSLHLFRNESSV